MMAGMPRVVVLKDWNELKDVPVIDSKTGRVLEPTPPTWHQYSTSYYCLSWTIDTGECYYVANFELTTRLPALDNPNLAGAWLHIAR